VGGYSGGRPFRDCASSNMICSQFCLHSRSFRNRICFAVTFLDLRSVHFFIVLCVSSCGGLFNFGMPSIKEEMLLNMMRHIICCLLSLLPVTSRHRFRPSGIYMRSTSGTKLSLVLTHYAASCIILSYRFVEHGETVCFTPDRAGVRRAG
jgi:hypothetical protein